jgi:hypothetical protein
MASITIFSARLVVRDTRCGHRNRQALGLGESEAHILHGQRRRKIRRAKTFLDNLTAVSLMHPRVEHRIGQDIECEMLVDPSFSQQG